MFLRPSTVKILVYTGKSRLWYSFFKTKMSKSWNENDRPDGNPLKQKLSMHEYCFVKHEWQLWNNLKLS